MNEVILAPIHSGLTLTYFLSLLTFAISMTITPGPNNLMVTASGLNFGYRKTLPHILGIAIGFTSLCAVVALGLGAVFLQFSILQQVLKIVGSAYLLYLAYKIVTSKNNSELEQNSKPLNVYQAALFQYVNPKAWTMAITGISAFSLPGEQVIQSSFMVVLAFGLVSVPCCSLWAMVGAKIRDYLANEKVFKVFNWTLGLLTAACIVIIISG